MMSSHSSKGAIKKVKSSKSETNVVEGPSKSKHRSEVSSRLKELDDKEKQERKKVHVIDLRAAGDAKLVKSKREHTSRKSILPDKNLILEYQKKKTAQSSKSISNEYVQKKESSRSKQDSSTSKQATLKKVSSKSNSTEKSVDRGYSEKRGKSTVYMPKDSAKKLSEKIAELENKRPKENTKKSKNSDKSKSRESSRERRRSRTLSPSEVKVLRSEIHARTKANDTTGISKSNSIENDYEDDFEDYESDFNSDTESPINEETDGSELSLELEPVEPHTEVKKVTINSADVVKVEEEHMLDSGHYELAEARKRAALIESITKPVKSPPPPLPEVKETNTLSYRDEKQIENKSLPSSADEGFEDPRSGDFIKSPPVTQVVIEIKKPLEKKEIKKIPKSSKILTRGQKLLNMIKLDVVEWSLYECQPVAYDEFISIHGKINTQQVSVQTNEDNLDVDIQTDDIEQSNKWTQFPVKCRGNLKTVEDINLFQMDHIGVGDDNYESWTNKNTVNQLNQSVDFLKLIEFVNSAGKVMLALLEEKELGGNILQSNITHQFPFSEGCIKLSTNLVNFLSGKRVSLLQHSGNTNKILLSIHAPSNEKVDNLSKQDYIFSCYIGCVWNINEPSKPIKVFYSQSAITSCCFHNLNNNIVFAGLNDGTMCLWDVSEEEIWHQKITDKVNESEWVVRSPTYTTANNQNIKGHRHSVVAVHVISKIEEQEEEHNFTNEKFLSIQICSLDESGHVIIWTVIRTLSENTDDLGLSYWGKYKLVKSQEIYLPVKWNKLQGLANEYIDMKVDSLDINSFYVATNSKDIMHVDSFGGKTKFFYSTSDTDFSGTATSIEVCPFKNSYFLAGCTDGSIRVHSIKMKNPILQLKSEKPAAMKKIQWSKSKAMTIFALDEKSRLLIWDLSISDVYPTHTILPDDWGKITCISLSPCNTARDMKNQYLALGTDTAIIEIHKLNQKFYYSKKDEFLEEINSFLNYRPSF